MRLDKRSISTFASNRLLNPLVRAAARRGLPLPGVTILETIGRKSGKPRWTPVGSSRQGDTVWIVAEHKRGNYVRNIAANSRVRVRRGRRWLDGTAHLLPDDDWRARQRQMPRLNALLVRVAGSDPITVRVDLGAAVAGPHGEAAADPTPPPASG